MDTNGTSLSWGKNDDMVDPLGLFEIVRLEKVQELGDGLYSLSHSPGCPSIGFNSDGHIFVLGKTIVDRPKLIWF